MFCVPTPVQHVFGISRGRALPGKIQRSAEHTIERRTHRNAHGDCPTRRDHQERAPQLKIIPKDALTLWENESVCKKTTYG
jgi:hypothetical protein